MKILSKIFSIFFVPITVLCLTVGSTYANEPPTQNNNPEQTIPNTGDVGDNGQWNTEHNRSLILDRITNDLRAFQPQQQLVNDYVPIEAKVGFVFIRAMTWLGNVLDNTLVRFVNIFLIVGFIFWLMAETYNMMTKTSDVQTLATNLVKKGALVAIWLIILKMGPAELFMLIATPIVMLGVYLSDVILNAVSSVAGLQLPDTCSAINNYVVANWPSGSNPIIDANATSGILCVPTRMSGFCLTAIATGFKWMIDAVGHSFFQFIVGIVFVVMFIYNMYKFAIMAFGVIADLFLGIFMLPFTAIAETMSNTSYKGIAGDIFNGFIGMFKTEKLSTQIARFINATVYFVSLSIVIAICTALLSVAMPQRVLLNTIPNTNQDFMSILITVFLVSYLARKSSDIAKDIGGKINDALGTKLDSDIKTWTKGRYREVKKFAKAIRDSKAKPTP